MRLGPQCGNHRHVLAPNVETIDPFQAPNVETIDTMGLRVSTMEVAFFLFFRQKEENSGFLLFELLIV